MFNRVFIFLMVLVPMACRSETKNAPSSNSNALSKSNSSSAVSITTPVQVPEERFPISDSELTKLVNPYGAQEYQGSTGSVEGTIKVTGDPSPIREFMKLPPECEPAKAVHAPLYRKGPQGELADAFVTITEVNGFVRPHRNDRVISIRNCSIEPRVIDLSIGQRLLVNNEDTMPFIPQVPDKKAIARVAIKGQSPVPLFLTTIGMYELSWLAALPGSGIPSVRVYVSRNALHAVTDRNGSFRITGVPIGKAKIIVSHAGMNDVEQVFEIKEKEVNQVQLTLTYQATTLSSQSTMPSVRVH